MEHAIAFCNFHFSLFTFHFPRSRNMALSERFAKLAADAKTRIREVSPAAARDIAARGGMLIDIRETDEFAKAHAAGATHLSKGVLEMKIEEAVPDLARPIVCYCGGGNRSALSADNLQKMGYTNVASMAGGFKAWKEQGLDVEANG
jgi:rhodanese-related sulfurtransferase